MFAGSPGDYANAGKNYKMTLSYNLWRYCSPTPPPNNDGSSYGWTIADTINTYLRVNRGITGYRAFHGSLPSTTYLKSVIDLGTPVILFGNLGIENSGEKQDHAVTVYGYNGNRLIAHMGWEGRNRVYISGLWGTMTVIS